MNAESRPEAALDNVPAVAAADSETIQERAAFVQALLSDPRVKRFVAYVGSVSREAGYANGYAAGYATAEADEAAHWRAAAAPIRRVLAMPTFDELQRRRYGTRRPGGQTDLRRAS